MAIERVMDADELWDGEMRSVTVAAQKILLVRLGDHVVAYEDRCPHKGVPLSDGVLKDQVITCSAHHWQYDGCTGHGINPQNTQLRRFPVRQQDGGIYIEVTTPILRIERNEVGPVLRTHTETPYIVEAIKRLNASARVIERGSYLRVLTPNSCVLTRQAVEEEKGESIRWPEYLEAMMPSFKGRMTLSEDRAIWSSPPEAI